MRDQAGPLPAQPYILVLWATHIGRYAIKHSPSENARASEPSRAIVKVLGTLCERSPLSPYPAVCTGTASATLLSLAAALHSALVPRRLFSSSSFLVALLSLFLPARSSAPCSPLRVCTEPRPGSLTPQTPSRSQMYIRGNAGETKRNYARKQHRKQRRSPPVEIAARPTLVLPSPSGWRWPPLEEDGEAGGKSEIGSGENDDARFSRRCCWLPRFGLRATIDQAGPTRTEIPCLLFRSFDTEQDDAGPRRCAGMKTTQTEKRKLCVAMTSLVALPPTLDKEDALARSPPDEQGRREKGCLEGVRGRDGERAAFVFVHVASTSSSSSSWARHSPIRRGE